MRRFIPEVVWIERQELDTPIARTVRMRFTGPIEVFDGRVPVQPATFAGAVAVAFVDGCVEKRELIGPYTLRVDVLESDGEPCAAVQVARIAVRLNPRRCCLAELTASDEFFAARIDPRAQSRPVRDERFVGDLDGWFAG